MYLLILNIAFGLAISLSVPGTEYVQGPSPDTANYEQHFNATQIATSWKQAPFSGIPVIGDIFAGFSFFWQIFGYLIDGFPTLLLYISNTYISDAGGQAAFLVISMALRALYAVLICTFLIEFISGRIFSD